MAYSRERFAARCLLLSLTLQLGLLTSLFAQITVSPSDTDVEVAVGSDSGPYTISIENLNPEERLFSTQSGSIATVTEELIAVPAGETRAFDVQLTTSRLEPGYYYDSVTVSEIFAKQASDYYVNFYIDVFTPGPPNIISANYEASPVEVFSDGISVNEDDYFALFLDVSGSRPLEFRWQFASNGVDFVDLVDSTTIEGQGTDFLEISPTVYGNTGFYRCLVSNDLGNAETDPFGLEVLAAPRITREPLDEYTVNREDAEFHVDAEGTEPLEYQWYVSDDDGITSRILTFPQSASTATLTISSSYEARYACVVSNPYGIAVSRFALDNRSFFTPPVSPTRTRTPVPTTIPPTLTPVPTTVAITTTAPPTISPTPTTPIPTPTPTSVATPTLPFISTQPTTKEVFAGNSALFYIEVNSALPVTYRWQFSTDGLGFGSLPSAGTFSGANTANLTIEKASMVEAGFYRCIAANDLGSTFSGSAELVVFDAPPTAQVLPEAIVHYVVSGQSFAPVEFTISNVGSGALTYEIFDSVEPWLGAVVPSSGIVGAGDSRVIRLPIMDSSLPLGEYEDTISISTNSYPIPDFTIPLTLRVVDSFTVTSLADSGPGSLRSIIAAANSTPGSQTILFGVEGTIQPKSELPALSDTTGGTIIDGEGKVIVDGILMTGFENGLTITSADNSILNMTVLCFPGNGILVTGLGATNNVIQGCHIGSDGTRDLGNRQAGIRLDGGSTGTTIGGSGDEGNTISGNSFSAVVIGESSGNFVRGNNMGAGDGGFGDVGNGGHGVQILPRVSAQNTIGGGLLFEANVIAGNGFFPGNLDVLVGRKVSLRALVHGTEDYSYEWFREGVSVGKERTLVIDNIQASDEGLYFCVISNAGGTTESKRTYVNVLSREEFVALSLLFDFASLDKDGSGGLSYNEAATHASRQLSKATKGGGGLSVAEFAELDDNGDGELSVAEVLASSQIDLDLVRYDVSPTEHRYADTNIDNGPAGTQTFTIRNRDLDDIDLFSTPTLTGVASGEYRIAEDTGGNVLSVVESRDLTIEADPSKLNTRAAYLLVRTDDFLLPTLPIPVSTFGFQVTPELLRTLLRNSAIPRSLGELDVNADTRFDGADIDANLNNGH